MGGPQRFLMFEVLFYLGLHPLTHNYQIWRGNTYWKGTCFRGSVAPRS